MKARLWLVAAGGALAATGAAWLAAHQPPGRPTEPGPALELLVGLTLLSCGLASWRSRPENRVGRLLVLIGFAWFAESLVDARPAWLNTIGMAVQSIWIIGLLYLLLSFPSGRLRGRLERRVLWVLVAAVSLQLLAMLQGSKAGLRCPGCSDNLIPIWHDNQGR